MNLRNGAELPDDATILLLVSGGKKHPQVPKDAPCERIDADALKCDEDGISVTCVECFEGDSDTQFNSASLAMRGQLKIRKSGVIAKIGVGDLKGFLDSEAFKVRVVLDRQPHNDGHSLIQGVDAADMGLKALVAQAFTDFTPVTDVPDLVND